ncbi:hypothetical protein HBN50_12040 [Halobacteriovorax sp. GB3]|uniref:hypothetical protein n=1 Tax=Halobacteriovorax sp. GB3 TaxID=2719615 RepID=UPI00235DDF92|nr:hypothetical protein [Halobacteriovorax sp. GB3]MDD0853832.1 hypothetical protein [Halobacteriovorax sp. GB3]
MAVRLDDVCKKGSGSTKSLLDMVLDRKEARYKSKNAKKKSLRPWQNFRDKISDERYYKKKSKVMKPFSDADLSDDEKLELQIKERAHELFNNLEH